MPDLRFKHNTINFLGYTMKRTILISLIYLFILSGCAPDSTFIKDDIAISSDSERIAYNVYGTGSTTLIFIHGWSCDSRYWNNQVPVFSKDYKVITIDLAGHGHSSSNRLANTRESFADDIKAVIEKEHISKAILIGHSLGGGVIAKCAELMPGQVISIIGVDSYHNLEELVSQEFIDQMIAPFYSDFVAATKDFVASAFTETADKELVNWVKEDMSSAPKNTALDSFLKYIEESVSGEEMRIFEKINIPVVSINARIWPTDSAANSRHIKDYKLLFVDGTGHFPMLEKPEEFNTRLQEALTYLENKSR
jgi:pimeloyl-ACP methyl ester carboxylesterase